MRPTTYARNLAALPSIALFCCLSGYLAQPASAGSFTLIDDNSSVDFDTASPNNADNWQVDGTNQLSQQAFWFRVGNGPEVSLHSLPISVEGASDTNFDFDDDTLFVRYVGTSFEVDVRYTLDGGQAGSGASDMAEQITINSTGESALDFHFFQYTDFDLNGTPGNDEGLFPNANSVRQFEPGFEFTETVITPVPNHRELSPFANILNRLIDGLPTTLNDTPVGGTVIGPEDLTWGYQWDFTLQPLSTFQISKDKHLQAVPEPATLVLLALGGLAIATRRRA